MGELQKTVASFVQDGDRKRLAEGFVRVHDAEGLADDVRREIEVLMYSKALFPESRGDILGLIEAMDKVPNNCEAAVRMILNQHIPLPPEFTEGILAMVDASSRCVTELVNAVRHLFSNFVQATAYVGKVDELESEVDHIEEDLIDRIFSGNEQGYIKILLRDLVRKISSISDQAENAGDRIRIMVAKRAV